ncbi:MAG: PKD domain-containing protein [Bacteroidetes bacterium]|nr:PKD domain-containing protein [Bacteroidota bacterium]
MTAVSIKGLRVLMALFMLTWVGTLTQAQDFSNKGKEFWIPFSYHVAMLNGNPGSNPPFNGLGMTLWISSDVATTYTVEIYGGANIQTGSLTAGQVVAVNVPRSNFLNTSGLITGKAVRVTSERPIVVYSYISASAVSGATVCLPTNVLGKEYISMNYTQISNESRSNSYFTIIAVEDNTLVEIVPSATTTNGWAAGSTNTVTLNKGEIFQVLGTVNTIQSAGGWFGEDLTGSRIRSIASGTSSCKRIAVFSGAGKMRIGNCAGGANSSDNLYQQLYPLASWGKNYLTVPSFERPTNFYRIIKSSPSSNVFLNGSLIPAASFVNDVFYEFSNTTPNSVTSDQPISLAQYFTTQGCSGNATNYDPDMILLNPVEQNISKVTLVSSNLVATAGRQHHIHVIMPNRGSGISSFRLDGNPVPASDWVTHPANSNFSFIYLDSVTQGYHTLSSDSGFNALAYGYANAESYGYSAGANVKDLYQYVSIETPGATVKFPTTCRNTPYYFTMTLPYKPTKLQWIFGTILNNAGIADTTLINPQPTDSTIINGRKVYGYKLPRQYVVPTVGLYPVRLIANNPTSDGCGGEQDISFDLDVLENPIAKLNFSNVCLGQPVTFTDASVGYGRSLMKFITYFGDNTTANILNPIKTYADTGNFTVKYVVMTDVGCISDTASAIIRVKPIPVATISGTNSVCLNDPAPRILFRATLGESPFTISYRINGGPVQTVNTASNSDTVSIIVPTNTTGIFIYNLIAVKEGSPTGCSKLLTGTATITVNPLPNATITGSTITCLNQLQPRITFTGSGSTRPYTFTYQINGSNQQTVSTLIGDTVSVAVPTQTATTYTYSLLSVKDGSVTGCSQIQSGTATVTVRPLPTATIEGKTSLCRNAPSPRITFTGSGSSAPYTFSYNINGGISRTVSTSVGDTVSIPVPTNVATTLTYNLLSVTDGTSTACTQIQSGSATITVFPLPLAAYTTNSPVCATGLISFTDQSTANSASLTKWQWNFDDTTSGSQNTSTQPNSTHVFAKPGTYNISFTVTNSNGCISVNTLPPFSVNPKPKAGFIIPEVCLNDTYAEFLDSSKVASPGTISEWNWNFGDPNWNTPPISSNTATDKDPRHSYKAVGNYDVSLHINTNHGCRDTIVQRLVVNGSFPIARFVVLNPTALCANDSVAIIDSSTVFPGVITKILIYWDDVNNPTIVETDENSRLGKIYKHQYPNFQSPLTKTYRIRLKAFSGGICLKETTQTITVNAAPKTRFNLIPNICFDAPPYQITEATEIGGVPGSFRFSGPGVSATGIFNPSLAGEGTHTIKYIFTSTTGGCTDSITQTIKVWKRAIADFDVSSSPICEKQPVTLTDKSSSQEGTITQWRWDYADGSTLDIRTSSTPFQHTFPVYATYPVKLSVVTSNRCTSAVKISNVKAHPLVRPSFTFPPVSCLPDAVIPFLNKSHVPGADTSTLSYLWNFGDPGSGAVNTSTARHPAHTYANLGPFNVRLQATTQQGCIHDTTIVLNTIHPQPIADFTVSATDVCLGGSLQFINRSNTQDGTLKTLDWNLGDGTTRNIPSFSYVYSNTGLYTVTLKITNSFDCPSTVATKIVSINPNPIADAGPNRIMLEGAQITIEATATNANGLTYLWTPAKGLNNPTLLKPIASPDSAIRYLLTVTSDKGCTDTSSMFLKVLYKPVAFNTFTPNGDGINDFWDILYIDSYPGAIIEVFSIDGQLIYRSIGYNKPWDGKRNGLPLPFGTYYYVIDPKNGRAKMAGYVTIIR